MKSSLLQIIAIAVIIFGFAEVSVGQLPDKGTTVAQSPPRKLPNLIYKTVGEQSLKLDIYLPAKTNASSALVVWIHGGGWRTGSKNDLPILPLVSEGFAVASVDYRLSGQARFPAQIEDVKSSLRWLRAHSKEYGLDPDRFGVIGHSAGGHLASLVGVTGRDSSFEVGDNLDRSSAVQAVCAMSGPSDMLAMFDGADENRRSALESLLGGSLPEKKKLATTASPLTYAQSGAPPFLFIHGADDQTVPVQQAIMMNRKLEDAGAKPKLIILSQTGHDVFSHHQQFMGEVRKFFSEKLKNE